MMTGYRRKLEQNFFCSIVDQEKKAFYYVYMLRKEGNCMEKEIMQGATSGQRRRGRPRTRWQDNNEVDRADWWSFVEICWRQKTTEEDYPWNGQSADRGRLKCVCVFYQWYSYVLLALGDLRVCSLYRRTHSRSRLAWSWVGDRLAPF